MIITKEYTVKHHGRTINGVLYIPTHTVKGSIILYYPAFMIPEESRKKYPVVKKIPPETEIWDMKLGKDYFASMHDFDPYKVIGKYKGKVLVLYGDQDDVVPRDTINKTMEVYGKSAELMVLEGEGHGFSEVGKKMAGEKILNFIEKL